MRITTSKFHRVAITAVALGVGLALTAVSPASAAGTYTFAGLRDWDRDGHQDVIAEDSGGILWLYPGESKRGYSQTPRVQIGNGWGPFTYAGIADWDRDGHQDIIARDNGTGLLWLYLGESKRGYSQAGRVQIGNGWQGYTFAGIADWDRDGHQDIVAEDSAGNLWLYPGDSSRGYSAFQRVQIGNGWTPFSYAGITDWDRDGHQDIIARDNGTGLLWLYLGQSKRGYSQAGRVQIGNGWQNYTLADVTDWDRDGHQDIVARDSNALLWLYPGDSSRGYSAFQRVQIGNGW
jgi:hypothetical protein